MLCSVCLNKLMGALWVAVGLPALFLLFIIIAWLLSRYFNVRF